jgi:hypothetical protein
MFQMDLLETDGKILSVNGFMNNIEIQQVDEASKARSLFCYLGSLSVAGGMECRTLDPQKKIAKVRHYGVIARVSGDPFSFDPGVDFPDIETGKPAKNLPKKLKVGQPAMRISWSHSGELLAVGGQGGGTYLFETQNWKLIRNRE